VFLHHDYYRNRFRRQRACSITATSFRTYTLLFCKVVQVCIENREQARNILLLDAISKNSNKRAQRALGRSPEKKVTVEPIIENHRGII